MIQVQEMECRELRKEKERGREREGWRERERARDGSRSETAREKEGEQEREKEGEMEREKESFPFHPSLAPPPTWRLWDLIGSSLLHLLCLLLLFLAYSWSELT